MKANVIVVDGKGDFHSMYAAKPYSSNPGDAHLMIVVHDGIGSCQPYVVHTMNLQTGGFSNGSYCSDLTVAFGVFNRR